MFEGESVVHVFDENRPRGADLLDQFGVVGLDVDGEVRFEVGVDGWLGVGVLLVEVVP